VVGSFSVDVRAVLKLLVQTRAFPAILGFTRTPTPSKGTTWCAHSSFLLVILAAVGLVSECLEECAEPGIQRQAIQKPPADPRPYTIGSDDLLDILVWKQPDVSGTIRVASDGTITVPLLGNVRAAGKTTDQLADVLTSDFSKLIHNPRVTVRVSNPQSQVIYVLGEINKPGILSLNSGEVLSQAIASAGGFTPYANVRKLRVVRREEGNAVEMTINFAKFQKGDDLSADIALERGDTVIVP
jgi:polysaccharide biosynthesis/export protein